MEIKIAYLRYFSAGLGALLVLLIYFGFQSPFYVITSGSMSPTINAGDLVIAQRVYPGEVAEGDIVVFRSPLATTFEFLTHRVTEVQLLGNGTALVKTKGDANAEKDPFFLKEELIVGRVIGHIPAVGQLILAFKNPIALLGVFAVVFASFFILRAFKEENPSRSKDVVTRGMAKIIAGLTSATQPSPVTRKKERDYSEVLLSLKRKCKLRREKLEEELESRRNETDAEYNRKVKEREVKHAGELKEMVEEYNRRQEELYDRYERDIERIDSEIMELERKLRNQEILNE